MAIALFACGLLISSTGLVLLQQLSRVYRTVDIAYPQSEQTFYDWLAAAARKHGLKSDHLARLIAQRLLVMGTTDRRNAVNSMMIDVFWDELAPVGTDRRPIFELMDKSTRMVLGSDPLSSELWLFAAWLRTNQGSFDNKASDYIELSQRFAPRDFALILQRLDFITQLGGKQTSRAKAAALADLLVVREIDPRAATVYSQQLQQ